MPYATSSYNQLRALAQNWVARVILRYDTVLYCCESVCERERVYRMSSTSFRLLHMTNLAKLISIVHIQMG